MCIRDSHETVLVSDGGAPLQPKATAGVKRIMRYTSVIQDQVGALRKRWLIDIYDRAKMGQAGTFTGTYWGIMSATERYPGGLDFGYSKKLAEALIAGTRTDLDPFSPNESWVLMKHGYELADAGIQTYVPELATGAPARKTWPAGLYDERRVEAALRKSSKRRYVRVLPRHKADGLVK